MKSNAGGIVVTPAPPNFHVVFGLRAFVWWPKKIKP
jgi:hypothetical protein